ncbi:MAG: SMC family ATPase [Methanomassiliicoccales archaeon]|jgi:exonuclease SbcC|nr:SMC family ATPase [Methanomassiliicoccales archaeon]
MELQNYRKFKHCALEFPDGVIGIIGPNGAGKSSLIEAIAWAIYGNETPIVRTTKEGVIRAGAGPNEECRVLLEFELEGDSYKLERSMRGRELKVDARLFVNNRPAAKGDQTVTEEMARRLGMDYKAFFISVFARQKDLAALSALRSSERKKLVLRMLEIDVLDNVVSNIDKDVRSITRDITMLSGLLLSPEGFKKIELLKKQLDALNLELERERNELYLLQEKLNAMEKTLAQVKARRDELKNKEEIFNQLKNRMIEKRERLAAYERKRAELETEIARLQVIGNDMLSLEPRYIEYKELMKKKDEMDKCLRAFEELRVSKIRLEKLKSEKAGVEGEVIEKRKVLASFADIEDRLMTVEKTMKEVDDRLTEAKYRLSLLDSEIEKAERAIKETEEKQMEIARLGPESCCPTCERPLGDYHALLLQKLTKEVEEQQKLISLRLDERKTIEETFKKEIERKEALEKRKGDLIRKQKEEIKLISELEHLQSKIQEFILEINELEVKITALEKITFDEAEYRRVKLRIQELEKVAQRYLESRAKFERLPELQEEMRTIEEQLGIERESLRKVREQIDSLGYVEAEAKEAYERYERAREAKQEVEMALKEKEGDIRLKEFEIKNIERQIKDLDEQERNLAEKTKQLENLSTLSVIMKGFRENVMSKIVPTLSEISSALFTELTDSKFGGMELDDDYEIYIYDGGDRYPISRFSGGEADLANLCLRLAISRIIAERAGSSVNFLILDEIFGSQDQTRKRNIMKTLNHLSKQFSQIILITHIDDVKDFMTHVINVREREDGTSEISLMG